MDEQTLFKRALDDIRAKMKGDRYELLRACGLLRHLLLDKAPLYVIVNRPHSLRITFKVTPHLFVVPKTGFMFQSPVPFIFGYEEVKIDRFLSFQVFYYEGYSFTGLDVI